MFHFSSTQHFCSVLVFADFQLPVLISSYLSMHINFCRVLVSSQFSSHFHISCTFHQIQGQLHQMQCIHHQIRANPSDEQFSTEPMFSCQNRFIHIGGVHPAKVAGHQPPHQILPLSAQNLSRAYVPKQCADLTSDDNPRQITHRSAHHFARAIPADN